MNTILIISLSLIGSILIYTLVLSIIEGHKTIKFMHLHKWINIAEQATKENEQLKVALVKINELIIEQDITFGSYEYYIIRDLCIQHINYKDHTKWN